MNDADELIYARDARDEIPPPRTRTGGSAAGDAEWISAMRPIARTDVEAYWDAWVDCRLPTKQWILTRGALTAMLVQIRYESTPGTVSIPHVRRVKVAPSLPGKLSLLVDVGSNINLIGMRVAMEFSDSAHLHGLVLKVLNPSRPPCVNGVGQGRAICR